MSRLTLIITVDSEAFSICHKAYRVDMWYSAFPRPIYLEQTPDYLRGNTHDRFRSRDIIASATPFSIRPLRPHHDAHRSSATTPNDASVTPMLLPQGSETK
jgi:hypothetical protein